MFPFFCLYSAFRLSVHPWVRDLYSYYVYPLIPFLILFLKTGTVWIRDRTDNSKTKFLSSVSKEKKLVFILILTFFLSIYRNSKETEYPIVFSPKPNQTIELKDILKHIPEGNSVSAGFHLSPFVSLKNPVYPIRENREWKEWILLDREYNSPYLSSVQILNRIDADVHKGKLRWVRKTNRFCLLRSNTKFSGP